MTEGEPERDVVTDLKLLREAVTVVLRRPVVELVRDAVGAPVLVRVNVTIPLGLDEIVSDRTLDVDIEALRFTLNESVVDTSIEALLERDIEAVGEVLREIVRGEVPVSLDVELGDAVTDPDAVMGEVPDLDAVPRCVKESEAVPEYAGVTEAVVDTDGDRVVD